MTLSNDDGMSVILTVEDEFFISEYLRLLLEQAGYEVVPTHNADEAIAVLERRSDIHTIITDINMPGSMDGLRLAAAVRCSGRFSKSQTNDCVRGGSVSCHAAET